MFEVEVIFIQRHRHTWKKTENLSSLNRVEGITSSDAFSIILTEPHHLFTRLKE